MIKQRVESIDIYKKNNRQDLLEVEQKEHEILSSFLTKTIKWRRNKKYLQWLGQKIERNIY